MRKLAFLIVSLLCVFAVSPVFAANSSITIDLSTLNNSGESGTATLTDMGNGTTQVVVHVNGEAAGASQPEHLHAGTCATLGKVVYPLKSLENGTSTTVVKTTLSALQSKQFALNGHESAANIGHYVFCGDVPMVAATNATALPKTGEPGLGLVVLIGAGLLGAGYAVRRRAA